MLAIRFAKIAAVAAIAFYMALVAFDNVLDYGTNFTFLTRVLDMDDVFPTNTLRWRAVTSPALHHGFYISIIAVEFIIAALCAAGAAAMILALRAKASAFQRAKSLAVLGLALGFLLYEAGFVGVAGEWFGMWEAQAHNAVQSAFRVAMTMLGVSIFICLKEDELAEP